MARAAVLAIALLAVLPVPAAAAPAPEAIALADRLVAAWTAKDGGEVARTHRLNAEWDFMSRTFLVLSLANLAVADADLRGRYLPVIDDVVADTLRAEREEGLYHFLMPYARAKPWVLAPARSQFIDGEIALMLAARLLLAPHDDFAAALRERVDVMQKRMRASPVRCAESYPDECWTFCNTIALAASRVADVVLGTDHDALRQEWLTAAGAHLIEPKTGLLVSSYTVAGDLLDGPEGSSIWLAAHMLQLVDPALARDQYDRAKRALAGGLGPWAFAREWPGDGTGPIDVDAGEVVPVLGASTGSSGLALVGAAAFRDGAYLAGLRRSLDLVGAGGGEVSDLTGGAVGQAVILYSRTVGPLWDEVQRRARTAARGPAAAEVDCEWFERLSRALREGGPLPTEVAPDAAKFWRAVEVCHASGPGLCEQAFAAARAVPSMAVSDGVVDMAAYEVRYLAACRSLPAPVQRCQLVSHMLANGAECDALGAREQMDAALRRSSD